MMTPNLQIRKQQTHKIPNVEYWTMKSDVSAPHPGTTGSTGYDLHCLEDFYLDRKEIRTNSTGIRTRIPRNHFVWILPVNISNLRNTCIHWSDRFKLSRRNQCNIPKFR